MLYDQFIPNEVPASDVHPWSHLPKSLSGHVLEGNRAVRFVFMDEAGISENEPVRVVVGLIADADQHVMLGESLVHEALGAVPARFRDGFVFSAKTVYGDPKYQGDNGWNLTDRLDLMASMMSIPNRIGMAISVSVHWSGTAKMTPAFEKLGLKTFQIEHLLAFSDCVAIADRNIRNYAGAAEVATIIAENHIEMRQHLKRVPTILRSGFSHSPSGFRQTIDDTQLGFFRQSGDVRVTRIRNSVLFVEKDEDPLVQVADACAYGFRRFFAKERFGVEFVRAILGSEDILKNFAPPCGAECYWPADNGPNLRRFSARWIPPRA